jgi:hypothetical protein
MTERGGTDLLTGRADRRRGDPGLLSTRAGLPSQLTPRRISAKLGRARERPRGPRAPMSQQTWVPRPVERLWARSCCGCCRRLPYRMVRVGGSIVEARTCAAASWDTGLERSPGSLRRGRPSRDPRSRSHSLRCSSDSRRSTCRPGTMHNRPGSTTRGQQGPHPRPERRAAARLRDRYRRPGSRPATTWAPPRSPGRARPRPPDHELSRA